MFNVNRIQLLLCATLLIHWTSASPSSRFKSRSAQSGRGSMAGEVRNLRILTGRSFSEAHILALVNPQYDKRLSIEFPKDTSSEHVVFKKIFVLF